MKIKYFPLLFAATFLFGQNFFESSPEESTGPYDGLQKESIFHHEESAHAFSTYDALDEYAYSDPDIGLDSGGNPGDPVPIDENWWILFLIGTSIGITSLIKCKRKNLNIFLNKIFIQKSWKSIQINS